jgi:hypothetical protein
MNVSWTSSAMGAHRSMRGAEGSQPCQGRNSPGPEEGLEASLPHARSAHSLQINGSYCDLLENLVNEAHEGMTSQPEPIDLSSSASRRCSHPLSRMREQLMR